jgi:hypothetical protein
MAGFCDYGDELCGSERQEISRIYEYISVLKEDPVPGS